MIDFAEPNEEKSDTMYLVQSREMSVELATALKDPDQVLEKIKNLVITDQTTYDAAAAERIAINKHNDILEKWWKHEVKGIDSAWAKLRALFVTKEKTGAQDYMAAALKMLGNKMVAYEQWCQDEDARKQREETERAAKAEQKRKDELAAQEARWIEKGATFAQVAQNYRDEAEKETDEKEKARLIGLADIAGLKAKNADAKAIERQESAQAVYIPPPVVPSSFRQAAGTSMQDHWTAVVDGDPDTALMSLVKAVASGTASISFVTFNMPALNTIAKVYNTKTKVPGVRFVNNPIPKSAKK